MSKLTTEQVLRGTFLWLQKEAYATAKEKGFHDAPSNFGERCAPIGSEVNELFEAHRNHTLNAPCDKATTPQITNAQEELADIVIRCLDFAQELGIDLGEGVIAKMAYNKTRPHKHGGKAC
jgi:NTP pyrophosphatase (non-canonical NTP hydrolase)